jgi:hypothetical protein
VPPGSIRKIQHDQYSVDLHITNVESSEIRASFMKNGTVAEVQGGALLNEATAELLAQMGVRLTSAGKQGLASGIVHFPKISADDLTDTLTVVVTRVNQLTGATISNTGYMRIAAGTYRVLLSYTKLHKVSILLLTL